MLVAALALSAPVHAQSDSDRAQASQMADEGVESYQRGEWAKALRLFQRAYSLVKAPSFLLYQARCFARLDNFDEADALYQRTIENGDGDKSATAQQAANEARGEQQILRMRRDSSRGVAPKPVTPPPPKDKEAPRPEPSTGDRLRTASWASFGVGAVGLIVGVTAGAVMLHKKSTLDDACTDNRCGPSQSSELSGFRSARTVSWVGWSIGLAGAAAGLTLRLIDRKPSDASKTSASLVIGPSFASLQGAF